MLPYEPTRRSAPIRDLQTALRAISGNYPEVASVVPDGIYGAETARSVSQFQQRFGLPDTGETNPETWDRIFETYFAVLLERKTPDPLFAFPTSSAVIGMGETGDIVFIIQVILTDLSRRFRNFRSIPVTGIYDRPTEREIARFQSIALLPQTGQVNRTTWDRLARFYRAPQDDAPLSGPENS